MLGYVTGAVRASLVTFALCGFAYPFAVTAVGQLLMPNRANGSIGRFSLGLQGDFWWFEQKTSYEVGMRWGKSFAPS